MNTRTIEKRNVTTVFTYEYMGHGTDAESVFAEYQTVYTIAKGVYVFNKFVRLVNEKLETVYFCR